MCLLAAAASKTERPEPALQRVLAIGSRGVEGESAAIRWPSVQPEPASHPARPPSTSTPAVHSRARSFMVSTPGWSNETGKMKLSVIPETSVDLVWEDFRPRVRVPAMDRVTPGPSENGHAVPQVRLAQDRIDPGTTCGLARQLTIPDAKRRRPDSDGIAGDVVCSID